MQTASRAPAAQSKLQVLVLDTDPATPKAIRESLPADAAVTAVAGVPEAVAANRSAAADVIFVSLDDLGDAAPARLEELRRNCPGAQAVAISSSRRMAACRAAFRAGACDFIVRPLLPKAVRDSVEAAATRRTTQAQAALRQQRLRTVCRRLSKSRQEISQQVDVLCHDLVKGYQQLALQLHQTQEHLEFAALVRCDMDIESLLRKAMGYLLKKIGACNGALFVPGPNGELMLGAYMHHDTASDPVFLDLLRDTLAAQVSARAGLLVLENDCQIADAFAPHASLLAHRTWLATGLFAGEESMGAMVLFRDQAHRFEPHDCETAEAVAAMLADQLNRVLTIHHRAAPAADGSADPGDPGDSGEFLRQDDSWPES